MKRLNTFYFDGSEYSNPRIAWSNTEEFVYVTDDAFQINVFSVAASAKTGIGIDGVASGAASDYDTTAEALLL